MSLLLTTLALTSLVLAAPRPPLQNITIAVPEGTSDHGDPHLLCTPAKASGIAAFFLGNYLTHVATIVPVPGETVSTLLVNMANTLFYPSSGVLRGLAAIQRYAVLPKGFWKSWPWNWTEDPLRTALKAGALCEVIRTKNRPPKLHDEIKLEATRDAQDMDSEPKVAIVDEEPSINPSPNRDDDDIAQTGNGERREGTADTQLNQPSPAKVIVKSYPDECFLPSAKWWHFGGRAVHGICKLPEGYALAILPVHAGNIPYRLQPSCSKMSPAKNLEDNPVVNLSCSQPLLRALIALAQLVFAAWTLYNTRGDQLNRYGYSAFGLTVTPYLVMSAVNLLGTLLTPSYPKLYLVHTHIMDEAIDHGGNFECIVAELSEDSSTSTLSRSSNPLDLYSQELVDVIFNISPSGMSRFMFGHAFGPFILPSMDVVLARLWLFIFPPTNKPSEENLKETLGGLMRMEAGKGRSVLMRSSAVLPKYRSRKEAAEYVYMASAICISLVPFAVIGGLSFYKTGDSSVAQRAWTMSWLAVGIVTGPFVYALMFRFSSGIRPVTDFLICVSVCLIYGAPAIGGMVVVGQMLQDYGSCYRVY